MAIKNEVAGKLVAAKRKGFDGGPLIGPMLAKKAQDKTLSTYKGLMKRADRMPTQAAEDAFVGKNKKAFDAGLKAEYKRSSDWAAGRSKAPYKPLESMPTGLGYKGGPSFTAANPIKRKK
jgi:hypothetical protein